MVRDRRSSLGASDPRPPDLGRLAGGPLLPLPPSLPVLARATTTAISHRLRGVTTVVHDADGVVAALTLVASAAPGDIDDAPRPPALSSEVTKAPAAEASPRQVAGGDAMPLHETFEAAAIGIS